MKDLRLYIIEKQNQQFIAKNLRVAYDAPEEVFLQVPKSYGESDIQIYMDDTMLDKLPAATHEKDLGKNAKELNDIFFEYDKLEPAQGKNDKADIEWDSHYDPQTADDELQIVRITNLKYVINFREFVLDGIENEDEAIKTIYSFFNGFTTDIDLPFEFTLNEGNISINENNK